MIAVDSSALIALVLGSRHGRFVERHLGEHAFGIAPHVIDAEVVSALRRLVAAGTVSEQRAIVALAHAASLRIVRFPLLHFIPRVWELRQSVTTSDAFFVALAEEAGVPLLTIDGRLARAHGHRATVIAP
jgi:predicted nucleic acid-binding protein